MQCQAMYDMPNNRWGYESQPNVPKSKRCYYMIFHSALLLLHFMWMLCFFHIYKFKLFVFVCVWLTVTWARDLDSKHEYWVVAKCALAYAFECVTSNIGRNCGSFCVITVLGKGDKHPRLQVFPRKLHPWCSRYEYRVVLGNFLCIDKSRDVKETFIVTRPGRVVYWIEPNNNTKNA